ncbi:hypothetical protein M427DRAFT_141825 [Gonapodya prolifera JEL478]|uniref:RNI-like protein n=1 Tax=Gonapodya prolifera (strain JEL478) TaxID=1344416 RepID=A0A139B053_GONPJ|nr:hypothetical protein M427DRAFT_141825 [Gonapodya prolifera JEL478]|eukprot:KXS22320.1 hypothetical protein M427DRAFT_141825 [Gonapodya prolifera JEL478]
MHSVLFRAYTITLALHFHRQCGCSSHRHWRRTCGRSRPTHDAWLMDESFAGFRVAHLVRRGAARQTGAGAERGVSGGLAGVQTRAHHKSESTRSQKTHGSLASSTRNAIPSLPPLRSADPRTTKTRWASSDPSLVFGQSSDRGLPRSMHNPKPLPTRKSLPSFSGAGNSDILSTRRSPVSSTGPLQPDTQQRRESLTQFNESAMSIGTRRFPDTESKVHTMYQSSKSSSPSPPPQHSARTTRAESRNLGDIPTIPMKRSASSTPIPPVTSASRASPDVAMHTTQAPSPQLPLNDDSSPVKLHSPSQAPSTSLTPQTAISAHLDSILWQHPWVRISSSSPTHGTNGANQELDVEAPHVAFSRCVPLPILEESPTLQLIWTCAYVGQPPRPQLPPARHSFLERTTRHIPLPFRAPAVHCAVNLLYTLHATRLGISTTTVEDRETTVQAAVDLLSANDACSALELAHYLDLPVLVDAATHRVARLLAQTSLVGAAEKARLPILYLTHPASILLAERLSPQGSLSAPEWAALWRRALGVLLPHGNELAAWEGTAGEVRAAAVWRWVETELAGSGDGRGEDAQAEVLVQAVTMVGRRGCEQLKLRVGGGMDADRERALLEALLCAAPWVRDFAISCDTGKVGWEHGVWSVMLALVRRSSKGESERADSSEGENLLTLCVPCSELGDISLLAGYCLPLPAPPAGSCLTPTNAAPRQQSQQTQYVRLVPDTDIGISGGAQTSATGKDGPGTKVVVEPAAPVLRNTEQGTRLHVCIEATYSPQAPPLSSSIQSFLNHDSLLSLRSLKVVGLEITGLNVSAESVGQIATIIRNLDTTLARLKLSGCHILLSSMATLCEAVGFGVVDDFEVSEPHWAPMNATTETSADLATLPKVLSSVFTRNHSTKRVCIKSVPLTGHSGISLCRDAILSGLQEIRFSDCNLGAAGLGELAAALSDAPTSSVPSILDLSSNGAPPRAVATLVQALDLCRAAFEKLVELDLSGAGTDGATALSIGRWLSTQPLSLHVLRLYGTAAGPHVGDQGFIEVMSGAAKCSTLEKVHLGRQRIGDVGAVWLGRRLGESTWPRMRWIGIEDNTITDVGAQNIGTGLEQRYTSGTAEEYDLVSRGPLQQARWGLVVHLEGNFISSSAVVRLESWWNDLRISKPVRCIGGVLRCSRQNDITL